MLPGKYRLAVSTAHTTGGATSSGEARRCLEVLVRRVCRRVCALKGRSTAANRRAVRQNAACKRRCLNVGGKSNRSCSFAII